MDGGIYDDTDILGRMNSCNVPARVQDYMIRCMKFHTAPAPGVLIGSVMVDYALELLGADPGEKLFAVCETPKCLPDALQVIAESTTGNGRLKVLPIGKFALTLNRATTEQTAPAIRVWVDQEKLKNFPIIDIWYANSPEFKKKTMEFQLQDAIFTAGRKILSYERVVVPVKGKVRWTSVTCPSCGENVPDYLLVGGKCVSCVAGRYYKTAV